MAGLIVFYLADVVLSQPGISSQASLAWQFTQNHGANVTILSALALIFLLRDKHLKTWEWVVIVLILVRMAIDTPWQVERMLSDFGHACLIPQADGAGGGRT